MYDPVDGIPLIVQKQVVEALLREAGWHVFCDTGLCPGQSPEPHRLAFDVKLPANK